MNEVRYLAQFLQSEMLLLSISLNLSPRMGLVRFVIPQSSHAREIDKRFGIECVFSFIPHICYALTRT